MGVYEGRGQLSKSLKDLVNRWAETRVSWDDANSRQFEQTYLVPLQLDVKAATGAMDQMAGLLQAIKRDCS